MANTERNKTNAELQVAVKRFRTKPIMETAITTEDKTINFSLAITKLSLPHFELSIFSLHSRSINKFV